MRPDSSVRLVQLQLGGPTSAKCTGSIRHGRNMGSTWGQLWPTRPQLRPNLGPLGSNFGPTWLQHAQLGPKLGPFGSNFGPSWGPHGFKMRDVAKLCPKLRHFGRGLGLHAHHISSHPDRFTDHFKLGRVGPRGFVAMLPTLGRSWAQLPPTQDQVVLSTCVQTCPTGPKLAPKWAPVRPNLRWRTAKFNPSRAKYARSFPLYPILWVRVVLIAKRLKYQLFVETNLTHPICQGQC